MHSVDFSNQVKGRLVPATVWLPKGLSEPRPLILVGHGGSGHKKSNLVLDIAKALVENFGLVVAAIDGPVHGDRRKEFADGPVVRAEFRDLWTNGSSVDPMVEDWITTIDYLCRMPEVNSNAIGWYGISMGTSYGIPVVAADQRIKCAALGMWGTTRLPIDRLIKDAKDIHVPVLFQIKTGDEIFNSEGQTELFNFIASQNKKLVSYPGGHTDPAGEQLKDIVEFLVSYLLPSK
jgi:dienelactone hydrolase